MHKKFASSTLKQNVAQTETDFFKSILCIFVL